MYALVLHDVVPHPVFDFLSSYSLPFLSLFQPHWPPFCISNMLVPPTTGPLHRLFLLSNMLCPQLRRAHTATSLRSLLKCYLLNKDFYDHPI